MNQTSHDDKTLRRANPMVTPSDKWSLWKFVAMVTGDRSAGWMPCLWVVLDSCLHPDETFWYEIQCENHQLKPKKNLWPNFYIKSISILDHDYYLDWEKEHFQCPKSCQESLLRRNLNKPQIPSQQQLAYQKSFFTTKIHVSEKGFGVFELILRRVLPQFLGPKNIQFSTSNKSSSLKY